MSKLIRRAVKKRGTALIVALQLTALTVLSLISLVGGPQQSANQPSPRGRGATASQDAPADSQVSADQTGQTAQAQNQTDQAQTETAQPLTAADKSALRKSAVFATKLYEPRASQVFNLATARAESAQQAAQQSAQESEAPNDQPTLTTDREDYQPFTYVYFTGTGFEPGETVNMIVVELSPDPQSFQPWDVVADENGNFQTSWYIFSEDFRGATFQATATGQSSQLTASATFTDAAPFVAFCEDPAATIQRDAFAWGSTVYAKIVNPNGADCYRVQWFNSLGVLVQTNDFPAGAGIVSLAIPSNGPSGNSKDGNPWSIKLYDSGKNLPCTNTLVTPTTQNFDVAHGVVVGAPTPAPLGGGGDNDVNQNAPTVVQLWTSLFMETHSEVNKTFRSFVSFDLTGSGISGTVTNAKLRLREDTTSASRTQNVNRVTAAWSESTITWTNQPGVIASPTDSQSSPATNNVNMYWTVTTDVLGFVHRADATGADAMQNAVFPAQGFAGQIPGGLAELTARL